MAGFPASILDHEMTLTTEATHDKEQDKKIWGPLYHRAPLTAPNRFYIREEQTNLFK